MKNKKFTVLVLLGGDSPEREVSLHSGKTVSDALKNSGHEVLELDPIDGFYQLDEFVNKVDVVFPILHGDNGEDGVIQYELEKRGFKYLGSDSASSKLAFDKIETHKILEEHGILMPRYSEVKLSDIGIDPLFTKPYVLKPIKGGSSLDTQIVREVTSSALNESSILLKKYSSMLLEQLVPGKEITVPVLNDRALSVIAIIPPENQEFSYENKYNDSSQEICPAPDDFIDKSLQQKAKEIAFQVHSLLGARHLSRTDLMLSDEGELFVLELNTVPGMRPQSLFPKAALAEDMNMTELVNVFLELVLGE